MIALRFTEVVHCEPRVVLLKCMEPHECGTSSKMNLFEAEREDVPL